MVHPLPERSRQRLDTFNELVAITRPNFLSKYLGSENLTDTDRDSYRAKVIRQKISN